MGTYNTLLPLAMLTVMMFLIWSDSIRPRRAHPISYLIRAALFAGASGVLVFNRLRYPHLYEPAASLFIIIAVLFGIFGTVHFVRRALG